MIYINNKKAYVKVGSYFIEVNIEKSGKDFNVIPKSEKIECYGKENEFILTDIEKAYSLLQSKIENKNSRSSKNNRNLIEEEY